MGKISPVSAKYIVHVIIQIEGVVERPDVIGAIFGQTEGLLGADLELRELQRSGRIGRIEVNTDIKAGKTEGAIIIPSSLDKEETVIIAAAMETIQRIGPCNARVKVDKIEDVRVSKRNFVIARAKELLRLLQDEVLPDSREIIEDVSQSVMMMGITEYGKDRLPAGPCIDESEEVIVVEGRADVLNLLKHGFKNAIALNGTSVPDTIKELSREKGITLFVDGDRGGNLIIKEVMEVCEVDYVIKAPDGKEVEEITKKEIHKALRNRVAAEQAKLEMRDLPRRGDMFHSQPQRPPMQREAPRGEPARELSKEAPRKVIPRTMPSPVARPAPVKETLAKEHKETFQKLLEDLFGTRGAFILDEKLNILGKVPVTELVATMKSLQSGIFAVILDGTITKDIALAAERTGTQHLVATDSTVKATETKVNVLTSKNFEA